jgi:hypothetical protein
MVSISIIVISGSFFTFAPVCNDGSLANMEETRIETTESISPNGNQFLIISYTIYSCD